MFFYHPGVKLRQTRGRWSVHYSVRTFVPVGSSSRNVPCGFGIRNTEALCIPQPQSNKGCTTPLADFAINVYSLLAYSLFWKRLKPQCPTSYWTWPLKYYKVFLSPAILRIHIGKPASERFTAITSRWFESCGTHFYARRLYLAKSSLFFCRS